MLGKYFFLLCCFGAVLGDQFLGGILIYPGTKWCGAGNRAKNDNDFGSEIGTDKCCQAHDKCPDVIKGFKTGHNLRNPNFYTRLHCDCDKQFYNCLKSVNTGASIDIGLTYFNVIHTKCFRQVGNEWKWFDEEKF